MTVSSPTTSDDVAAITLGGNTFIARMKALEAAKASHDEALSNLRIGHDVIRAMQDVQVREQAAIDAMNNVRAEADRIVGQAHAEADRIVGEAKDAAAKLAADAKEKSDQLVADVDAAHAALGKWSDKIHEDRAKMAEVREASEGLQAAFRSLHERIVAIAAD